MQQFNENSRVKLPTILHLCKFGYTYLPLSKADFKKIIINRLENQKLSELRDWLLPMLMNGQVKVGDNRKNSITKSDSVKKH